MGGNSTKTAQLRIVNNTNKDIVTTSVYGINSDAWDDEVRIDNNFVGVRISANDYEERIEKIVDDEISMFTMLLKFEDGTVDEFRINMFYATVNEENQSNWNWNWNWNTHAPFCMILSVSDPSLITDSDYKPDPKQPYFYILHNSHDISYHRSEGNTLVIDINNTAAQIENIDAEQINQTGEELLKNGQYEEAKQKFHQAYYLANEDATIKKITYNKTVVTGIIIKKKQNDKAVELNATGLEYMKIKNYGLALEKFREALKFANENDTIGLIKQNQESATKAESNVRAEVFSKKGEEEIKKKNYYDALQLFQNGLKLATKEETTKSINNNLENLRRSYIANVTSQSEDLIKDQKFEDVLKLFEEALNFTNEDSIKVKKMEVHNLYAKKLFDEGLTLEKSTTEDKSEEASEKFKQAEQQFTLAGNEYNLKNTKIKIAANEIFNEAVIFERDAVKLFQNNDFSGAVAKYEDALKKYKASEKKFEEGSIFGDSLEIIQEEISNVEKHIASAKKAELDHNLNKLHVKNEGGEKNRSEEVESTLTVTAK